MSAAAAQLPAGVSSSGASHSGADGASASGVGTSPTGAAPPNASQMCRKRKALSEDSSDSLGLSSPSSSDDASEDDRGQDRQRRGSDGDNAFDAASSGADDAESGGESPRPDAGAAGESSAAAEVLISEDGLASRASAMFVVGQAAPTASRLGRAATEPTGELMQLAHNVVEGWSKAHVDARSQSFGNFDRMVALGWVVADALGEPLLEKETALKVGFAASHRAKKIAKESFADMRKLGKLAADHPQRATLAAQIASAHAARLAELVDMPDMSRVTQAATAAVSRKREREARREEAQEPDAPTPARPRGILTEWEEAAREEREAAEAAARAQLQELPADDAFVAAFAAAEQAVRHGDRDARDAAWAALRDAENAIVAPLKVVMDRAEAAWHAAADIPLDQPDDRRLPKLERLASATSLAHLAMANVLREQCAAVRDSILELNTAAREAMFARGREMARWAEQRMAAAEAAGAAMVYWDEDHPDPEERRLRRIACSMENEDIRQLMAENEQLREQLREARGATDAAR